MRGPEEEHLSPDIFPVYFRYAIPEGQIPHSEIEAILALTKNANAFSDKLLELSQQHRPDGSTKVSVFLERLQDYTQKDISKEYIPNILQTLFDIGDKLIMTEDGLVSNDIHIHHIMFQLLKRYKTQDERFKVLKEAFLNGYAVSMIVREVTKLRQQHGKYNARAKPENECLISAQHVEELEKIALNKIKQAVSNKKLLKTPNLVGILYKWRDREGGKPVREWASNIVASDEGLVDFLAAFPSKTHIQGVDVIEPFVKPAEIIDRCKNLLKSSPEWLKDEKKIAIETFIKQLEDKDSEEELEKQ
jgi:predicted KAP-like P-loop ATPase